MGLRLRGDDELEKHAIALQSVHLMVFSQSKVRETSHLKPTLR